MSNNLPARLRPILPAISGMLLLAMLKMNPAQASDNNFEMIPMPKLLSQAESLPAAGLYVLAARLFGDGRRDEATRWLYIAQTRARCDIALFLDLDLAVLGGGPGTYDADERGIAAEYVPLHGEPWFRAGRHAFLQGLMTRPRLFLTDDAHVSLDGPARANISRALKGLANAIP